jgi:hypothetical protein
LYKWFCIAWNTVTGGVRAIKVPKSDSVVTVFTLVHGRTGTVVTSIMAGLASEVVWIVFGHAFALTRLYTSVLEVVAICAVVESTSVTGFAGDVAQSADRVEVIIVSIFTGTSATNQISKFIIQITRYAFIGIITT